MLLAILAYSNLQALVTKTADISFILIEGAVIGKTIMPIVGITFLIVAGVFLFATQMTVLDATSRIMSENICILSLKRFPIKKLPVFYYSFLWLQIFLGIFIFMFVSAEPLYLLTLGAVLNAFAMFIHIGATLWLNLTSLPKSLQPGILRISVMGLAFLFFGGFSLFSLTQSLI